MNIGDNAKQQLRSIIDRIENLEAEKVEIAEGIRDIYAEAKGNGYSVPALRAIIKIRRQDEHKRAEHEAIVDTYLHALGMTPIEHAIAAVSYPHVDVSNPPFLPADDGLDLPQALRRV